MRANHQPPKKREGVLGIRRSVWLVALGPVALLTLFLLLPGYQASRDTSPALVAPRHFSNIEVRTRGIRFIPFHPETDMRNGAMDMIEQQVEDRRTWVDNPDRNFR